MAPDHEYKARGDAPQHTSTAPSGSQSDRSSTGTERGDRERSIATQRETTSQGAARRSSGTPAYGAGLGPFSLMRRMTEDMDRLFENLAFGRALGLGPSSASADRDLWLSSDRGTWLPQVETLRRGDKFVVRADLPGMKKEDVTAEVDNGVLTISGERCDEREDTRDDLFRSERSYGQFYRAIQLPEGVTGDQVEATFKDGVLEVTLPVPKQADRKAKQIQIR